MELACTNNVRVGDVVIGKPNDSQDETVCRVVAVNKKAGEGEARDLVLAWLDVVDLKDLQQERPDSHLPQDLIVVGPMHGGKPVFLRPRVGYGDANHFVAASGPLRLIYVDGRSLFVNHRSTGEEIRKASGMDQRFALVRRSPAGHDLVIGPESVLDLAHGMEFYSELPK